MTWSLEIHHIDVAQGDSTLIIARNDGVGFGHVVQVRSALVDGGRLNKTADVHNYVTVTAALAAVDTIIATHYDADHFDGLRGLLNLNVAVYDNANIFDQGEPGNISVKRTRTGFTESITGREQPYQLYLNAIGHRGARTRVTDRVSSNTPSTIAGQAGWQDPDWLNGRELLWHGVLQPVGAPTITCVAVNQYVDTQGGPHQSGMAVDPKNEKSLALLVEFGGFRYYLGGDLESAQEALLAVRLNATNNIQGRVLAMKASHHGSDRSTANTFVNRLRPSAAFISCGCNNGHHHPRPIVLNNLQACPQLQHYYLTADRNDQTCTTRVGQVALGMALAVAPNVAAAYTAKAVVAGCWGPPVDAALAVAHGDIVLTVSDAQSQRAVWGVLPFGQDRFTVTCSSADTLAAAAVNNPHT